MQSEGDSPTLGEAQCCASSEAKMLTEKKARFASAKSVSALGLSQQRVNNRIQHEYMETTQQPYWFNQRSARARAWTDVLLPHESRWAARNFEKVFHLTESSCLFSCLWT